MEDCNKKFLEQNHIDINYVQSMVDCTIYSPREINFIVDHMGFEGAKKDKRVSVADIVGYDYKWMGIIPNIFESMDGFFQDYGDGYHTRSLGMLEFDRDTIIQGLMQSFDMEPMVLKETGEETYVICSNGLHRFTILRILFLSEMANAIGDESKLRQLREKYLIPTKVIGVDLTKTYCKYLLRFTIASDGKYVRDISYDYNNPNGRYKNVLITYSDNSIRSLNDDELIEYTREAILNDSNFYDFSYEINSTMDKYQSFRKFMIENFPEVCPKLEELKAKGLLFW